MPRLLDKIGGKRKNKENQAGTKVKSTLASSSVPAPSNTVPPKTHDLIQLNRDYPPPEDNEETYPLDIVAVHGINGDAYNTWMHDNETMWLQDFLPTEFPGSRVFTFGYDADVFFSLGTGNLKQFAGTLLEKLKSERLGKESCLLRERILPLYTDNPIEQREAHCFHLP